MSISSPTDPRALVAYGIAEGIVHLPKPPVVSVGTMLNRKVYERRNSTRKRTGDRVSRSAQAQAMAAAGWSQDRIARRLNVTTRSVRNYLRQ